MLVVSIGAPDEEFPGATGFSDRIHPGKLTAASEERIQTAIPSYAEMARPGLPATVLRIDFLLNHALNRESGHA